MNTLNNVLEFIDYLILLVLLKSPIMMVMFFKWNMI